MATSKSFLPNLWNIFSAIVWQRVMNVDLQFQNIPRHSLLRKIPLEVNRLNQSIVSRPWNGKWYFCLFGGARFRVIILLSQTFGMRIVWYGIFCKYLDHRYFWITSFSLVSPLQEDSLIFQFFLQVISVVLMSQHLAKGWSDATLFGACYSMGYIYINLTLISIQGSMDIQYQVRLVD